MPAELRLFTMAGRETFADLLADLTVEEQYELNCSILSNWDPVGAHQYAMDHRVS
jgi:hypothetical protein